MTAVRRSKEIETVENRSQPNEHTVRNLVFFIVAVLVVGWVGHGLDMITGSPASEGPGMLIWLVLPAAVALLLRAFGGDGWKDFGIRLNFKGNAGWYAIALLVYPILTALVLAIGGGLGLVAFPGASLNVVALILWAFTLGLLPQFIKNVFEETGWRGYLAPRLHSLRLSDFTVHFIVGLVWGAWHIPYYLFFLDRAVLQDFTTLSLGAFVSLSIVAMISWAVVYGEIRLLTNSIWPAVMMHTVANASVNQLFTEGHIRIAPGMDWLVSPVNGLISIILFAATGIGLHQLRKRRAPVS